MEAEIAEESETMQIGHGKAFQNVMNIDKFSDGTAEIDEQESHKATSMNGDSWFSDKVREVEQKLKLAQQRIEELEKKLIEDHDNVHAHGKDKEVQMVLFEEKWSEDKKEREDTLAERERLKVFEMEATRLGNDLNNSKSKIEQLELHVKEMIERLDGITKTVLVLREKEVVLQEQLAAAKFKTKVAEEKFNMQTEILQREMKMRALMDNELDGATAAFDRQELDLTQFVRKLIYLEGHLESSVDKTREYEKLDEQNEKNVVKGTESAMDFEKLSTISESRAKEMEQLVTSLQEQIQGLHEKYSLSEQTQEALRKTEAKLFEVEEELKHSQERVSELERKLNSAELVMEKQDKLAAVELDLKSPTPMEIEFQSNLNNSDKQLTTKESLLKKTAARCMELDLLLESQAKSKEVKRLEAKETYMHADSEAQRLLDKLESLEVRVKESEDRAALASPSSSASNAIHQILQMKGVAERTRCIGRSLLLSLGKTSGMTERMPEDQDFPPSEAKTSWVIKCAKLFNIGFQIMLGITLALIWAIYWKMFMES